MSRRAGTIHENYLFDAVRWNGTTAWPLGLGAPTIQGLRAQRPRAMTTSPQGQPPASSTAPASGNAYATVEEAGLALFAVMGLAGTIMRWTAKKKPSVLADVLAFGGGLGAIVMSTLLTTYGTSAPPQTVGPTTPTPKTGA